MLPGIMSFYHQAQILDERDMPLDDLDIKLEALSAMEIRLAKNNGRRVLNKVLEHRPDHRLLFDILDSIKYNRFISIEMGNKGNLDDVKKTMEYIKSLS